MTVYGYARVSTDGQSLTAQLTELKAAKCAKIFQEKISGARSDRKQLTRLMTVLAKGDVLVVTRLDRLARSTRDLLNLLGTIAEEGAGFKSLRDTWADTTTAHGRLMLTVLGSRRIRARSTGQSYYIIRVSMPPTEVARLGEVKIIPGMPVEAFVQTGDRTMFSYLMKPFSDQLMRSFRER